MRIPQIVYVTSRSHSGSTLLDLLVSSHSDVISVGECRQIAQRSEHHCSCQVRSLDECPFWTRVSAVVEQRVGLPLAGLQLCSPDPQLFDRHNAVLYEAASALAERGTVLDSSKDLGRLAGLLAAPSFRGRVRAIHLVRNANGVAYSAIRKSRSWVGEALRYNRDVLRAADLLADQDHLVVRYERLAEQPRYELERVMEWLGLRFEEEQLRWAGRVRHNVGGNRMRFSQSSEIRPDVAWQKGLRWSQRVPIWLLTLPARRRMRELD